MPCSPCWPSRLSAWCRWPSPWPAPVWTAPPWPSWAGSAHRGLASVVFGLIAVDSLAPSESKVVLAAVTLTVALSVLLHGVTASPLAARYGTYAAAPRSGGAGAHRGGADIHAPAATDPALARPPGPGALTDR